MRKALPFYRHVDRMLKVGMISQRSQQANETLLFLSDPETRRLDQLDPTPWMVLENPPDSAEPCLARSLFLRKDYLLQSTWFESLQATQEPESCAKSTFGFMVLPSQSMTSPAYCEMTIVCSKTQPFPYSRSQLAKESALVEASKISGPRLRSPARPANALADLALSFAWRFYCPVLV